MGWLELICIGIGLSMDAVAVSMTNGMVYQEEKKKLWKMPLFFGGFQAIMPILGFLLGGIFASFISKYAGITAFFILGVIGGNMIWEGVFRKDEEALQPHLTDKTLFLQAIATSIDAFVVGIGFCGLGVSIVPAAVSIGCITFFFSGVAMIVGKKCGDLLGSKAEIFGGIILILIGIKSLL